MMVQQDSENSISEHANARAFEVRLLELIDGVQNENVQGGKRHGVTTAQISAELIKNAVEYSSGVGSEVLSKTKITLKSLIESNDEYGKALITITEAVNPYLNSLVQKGELVMDADDQQSQDPVTYYWVT